MEKSTAPFPEQVSTACKYLDIDIEGEHGRESAREDTFFQDLPSRSNPRVDYALRWLLKQINHREAYLSDPERPKPDQQGDGGRDPCLNAHAWTLLKAFIVRTLPTNVARLLKEHKFINGLEYALCFLASNHLHSHEVLNSGISQAQDTERFSSSDESADSSAKRNRKRKRGQEDPTEDRIAGQFLYVRVCRFLETLLQMAQDPPQDSDIYIVEYLKASLRAPPEQAANVLGYAMRYVNNKRNRSKIRYAHSTNTLPLSISPFIRLWELAAEGGEGRRSTELCLSFSKSCLIPILDWLDVHNVPDGAPASSQQPLIKYLEATVVANVILPGRGAYLNANRPEKARNPDIPTTMLADLLAPLRLVLDDSKLKEVGGDLSTSLHDTARRAALVFRLATENPPRVTPKQKAAEKTWLQKLFGMLVEMITTYDVERSGYLDSSRYECHHPILQVALQKEIRVETALLKNLLLRHSGLFVQGPDVDWSLINICIRLDPHLWIFPNALVPMQIRGSRLHYDDLISPLLSKLSNNGMRTRSSSSTSYKSLLHKIIYPLIDAFIEGRQLTRFLELWCAQISIRLPETRSLRQTSVWEDEALIKYVSQKVESSLTYSQIISFLHDYSGNSTAVGHRIPGFYDRGPYLVMLDCVLSADFTERAMEELGPAVARLYDQFLTEIIVEEDPWKQEEKWKIIMMINDRWRCSNDLSENEHRALEHAIEFGQREYDGATSQAHLLVLRYMMRIAKRTFPVSHEELQHLQSHIANTISGLIFQSHSQLSKTPNLPQMAFKPLDEYSQGADRFLLLFFANVTFLPSLLDVLPHSLVSAIFEALYNLASDKIEKNESSESQCISFLILWKTAMKMASKGEWKKVSKELAVTLNLMAASIKTKKKSHLAIQTIPNAAIHLLEKNKCTEIANAIIETLLYTAVDDYQLLELLKALHMLSEHFTGVMQVFKSDLPINASDDHRNSFAFTAIAGRLDDGFENRPYASQELEYLKRITATILAFHARGSLGKTEFFPKLAKALGYMMTEQSEYAFATAVIIQTCLNHLASLKIQLPQQYAEVQAMRLHQCHLVQSRYIDFPRTRMHSPHSELLQVVVALDCLRGYSDILVSMSKRCGICGHEINGEPLFEALRARQDAATLVNGNITPLTQEISDEWYQIREHEVALLSLSSKAPTNGDTVDYIQNLKVAKFPYEKRILLKQWHRDIEKDSSIIQKTLREIVSSMRSQAFPDIEPLLLLHKMIPVYPSFQRSHDKNISHLDPDAHYNSAADKEKRENFTILLNGACNTATQTSKASMCILSLTCINTMLRSKAQMITQWHVDSIMACIAITAQRFKEVFNPKAASYIHIALTRVFGSVLAAHRLKLGGRYHMILLALKVLLNPLFTPFKATPSSMTATDTTPPIDHSQTFTSTHTENLSRLLSSISDPTVSAVSHRHRNSAHRTHQHHGALNDETKKARTESGKHMPYFIMEFCVLQLSGRMVGEGMREKLMPGIWAVLNAMNKEVMGAMNAQMSVAGREIWREVYAEWKRDGRRGESG